MKSPEFKNNLRINFIQSSGSISASSIIVSKITEVTSCDLKKQSGNDPHSKRSLAISRNLKRKIQAIQPLNTMSLMSLISIDNSRISSSVKLTSFLSHSIYAARDKNYTVILK
jgi:hypothetical protein